MLCTGQRANTEIMGKMDPATVDPGTHLVHVLRTLQVGVLKPEGNKNPEGTVENTPYSHIFAVGDAADAFGAIQAGHTAYAQVRLTTDASLSKLSIEQPAVGRISGEEHSETDRRKGS